MIKPVAILYGETEFISAVKSMTNTHSIAFSVIDDERKLARHSWWWYFYKFGGF